MAGNARKMREKELRKKLKKSAREAKHAAYAAKIRLGTNSRRQRIASRKGEKRLAKDHKGQSPAGYRYTQPNRFGLEFWS